MAVYSAKLPRVSKEVVESLEHMFRVPEITPETYRDRLMYEAGQQVVIDKLRAMVAGQSLNGINREAF